MHRGAFFCGSFSRLREDPEEEEREEGEEGEEREEGFLPLFFFEKKGKKREKEKKRENIAR